MNYVADTAPQRARAALLWAAVTATGLTLGRIAGREAAGLVRAPAADFAALLVQLCAVVAFVALAALWLLTTDVVRQVWRPDAQPAEASRPGQVRSLLLAACGVAVLSGTTTAAAFADEGPDAPLSAEVLDGLPLPDRATGAGPQRHTTADDTNSVRVRAGDSLWVIAARSLGPTASAADVASYWHQIHAVNVAVIGPDPDLLHPGQQLHLPPR